MKVHGGSGMISPMKKLIRGIIDFQKNMLPSYKETFAKLALGQAPDSLFIACSDSRVVPNLFASTDPGDLFVIRNVGNLIPPCGDNGVSVGDESEAAAIEFALVNLNVKNIIVCGHSECGAMNAIFSGREKVAPHHLRSWLAYGNAALMKLKERGQALAPGMQPHNQLSQLNVLMQLEHLKTYAVVQTRLKSGNLKLHGWWFDIAQASVLNYEEDQNSFVKIDEEEGARLLARLES